MTITDEQRHYVAQLESALALYEDAAAQAFTATEAYLVVHAALEAEREDLLRHVSGITNADSKPTYPSDAKRAAAVEEILRRTQPELLTDHEEAANHKRAMAHEYEVAHERLKTLRAIAYLFGGH